MTTDADDARKISVSVKYAREIAIFLALIAWISFTRANSLASQRFPPQNFIEFLLITFYAFSLAAVRTSIYSLTFRKRLLKASVFSTAFYVLIPVVPIFMDLVSHSFSSEEVIGLAFYCIQVAVPCVITSVILAAIPFEKLSPKAPD